MHVEHRIGMNYMLCWVTVGRVLSMCLLVWTQPNANGQDSLAAAAWG